MHINIHILINSGTFLQEPKRVFLIGKKQKSQHDTRQAERNQFVYTTQCKFDIDTKYAQLSIKLYAFKNFHYVHMYIYILKI